MDSLENLEDLLNSCLLPELRQDLDTLPLEEEHFKSYHDCLRIQLPLLYDWIQQEPTQWLFALETDDKKQQEIQSRLIILLCELSSPKYLFQLKSLELIDNCDKVLRKFPNLSRCLEQLIFRYYEEKLGKDVWKRQLGAVHGFVKYLTFRYDQSTSTEVKMNQQFLMFCLSVGLNIRTCYETHYKYLSTCIFAIMLKHGNTDDIVSMNIHSVIYDAIFKELHVMDSLHFIDKQWNCLLSCFDFFTDMDSLTWSKLDDSMDVLLRYIPLAPNSQSSKSLMKFVGKMVVYFNINRQDFENKLSQDLTQSDVINECRQFFRVNASYSCYRWAKAILQTFILESYRLTQSPQICKEMLLEIHRCYMATILPIDLNIIDCQLITFFEKFTAVLMDAARIHSHEEDVIEIITKILETFLYQVQMCDTSHSWYKFKEAYQNILTTDTFKRYVSV